MTCGEQIVIHQVGGVENIHSVTLNSGPDILTFFFFWGPGGHRLSYSRIIPNPPSSMLYSRAAEFVNGASKNRHCADPGHLIKVQ